jgi:hypothetical protein
MLTAIGMHGMREIASGILGMREHTLFLLGHLLSAHLQAGSWTVRTSSKGFLAFGSGGGGNSRGRAVKATCWVGMT